MEAGTEGGANIPAPVVIPLFVTLFVFAVSWLLSRDNVSKRRRAVRLTNDTERGADRGPCFEGITNGGRQTTGEVLGNNGGLDNGAHCADDKYTNCHLRLTLTIKEVRCVPTQSTFQRQLSRKAIQNSVGLKSKYIRGISLCHDQRQVHSKTHERNEDVISISKDVALLSHEDFNIESRVTCTSSEELEPRGDDEDDRNLPKTILGKDERSRRISLKEELCEKRASKGITYPSRIPEIRVSSEHDTCTVLKQVRATNTKNITEKYTFKNCEYIRGLRDSLNHFGTLDVAKTDDVLLGDGPRTLDETGGRRKQARIACTDDPCGKVINRTGNNASHQEKHHASVLSDGSFETEDFIQKGKCSSRLERVISDSQRQTALIGPQESGENSWRTSKRDFHERKSRQQMELKSILRKSSSRESLSKICDRGQKGTEANKHGGRPDVGTVQVTAVSSVAGLPKVGTATDNNLVEGSDVKIGEDNGKLPLSEKTTVRKTETSANAQSRVNSRDNLQSQCSGKFRSSSRQENRQENLMNPSFLETEIPVIQDLRPEYDENGSNLSTEESAGDKIATMDHSVCSETTGVSGNSDLVLSSTYSDFPLSSATENPPMGFIFVISKRRGSKQITGGLSDPNGIPSGQKNTKENKDLRLNNGTVGDTKRAEKSGKQGVKGQSFQSCHGIKRTTEQKIDLQQSKHVLSRNTAAVIPALGEANMSSGIGNETQGAINVFGNGRQNARSTFDGVLESPATEFNVLSQEQKCSVPYNLDVEEMGQNYTKSVKFKLEHEIIEANEGQKHREQLNGGVTRKSKGTIVCSPGNGLELSEFESVVTSCSENRHSVLSPVVRSVNSGTKGVGDGVDSGLLESGRRNIAGTRSDMDGSKYPLHGTEPQNGRKRTEDRAVNMPGGWQTFDPTADTDSDTTSTLSSPTFGSSTNASYGGSSGSNSSSDLDFWRFDWGSKKKREEKRARIRTDAIAENTDSSEDFEVWRKNLETTEIGTGSQRSPLQESNPKEVYSLTGRQTGENVTSTHISDGRSQINPATQDEEDGAQVLQGGLTGTDHLDDPMHGAQVKLSTRDNAGGYSNGRAFALVAAGRAHGDQNTQNVKGDQNGSENVTANFFGTNFPNGRVFVALGTKGKVTNRINGDTGAINEEIKSCEIPVTGATTGGTTERGHTGHVSSARAPGRNIGEVVSCVASANRGGETVNRPAYKSPLPVITVTSDDDDRPQTNVIFPKDIRVEKHPDIPTQDPTQSGLDISLTRSFWTKSSDHLPEKGKGEKIFNGFTDRGGSLPDVRIASTQDPVFSGNVRILRNPGIEDSSNVLGKSSAKQFELDSPVVRSNLHSLKAGCEEGDTLSSRFPSSKGSDTDTCQNSLSDIPNTSVTGDGKRISRTSFKSEMVVLVDPVSGHERVERKDNCARTEEHRMIRERRDNESKDGRSIGVEPTEAFSHRRVQSAMEPRESGPPFRSEAHVDIPSAQPLRRQDSLTKSSGIFFSSLDFVNKPPVERSRPKTTGRATDLDRALRGNPEYQKFNGNSTYPGDQMGVRSHANGVKGRHDSNFLRHDQRSARIPRSRSKSPNEVRVQEALRKLDLPGWYVNSDVAKTGIDSAVLKRSRSAETTLSDSGTGTLPRQNPGEGMSYPSGGDPDPIPTKTSPPSGPEPVPSRGRRQSKEERLSEFYSQRNLHPYPNRGNVQDNREGQSSPVYKGTPNVVTGDFSPEQHRRFTRAEPDSRESTPEHSPKAHGDHENEKLNMTWSSSEMSIDLPSSEERPESALPTLSPPLHRKTPPVVTLSASPTRFAALTRSNPNLHEVGKAEDLNLTITITETPKLDLPFMGMKDLENQNEDVSLEDMLDSLLALGSRSSSKSGSRSPSEARRLSEDRLSDIVAETLPFERRASDPGGTASNNQLDSTLMSDHTTYDFAKALDALNTTSSSVDTSLMNTTSSSLDTTVEMNTSPLKASTSSFQMTTSFFETASSAAPDTTSGSFSASELRDIVTDERVTVRCSYQKCKRVAELKEARESYKSCHNCYTYYCSRECRKNHWEKHKKKCIFSQINSACKHMLQYSRTNEEVQKCFSRVARTGYLSRGRGCVMLSFPSLEDAEAFLSSGLPALPTLPGFKTLRELEGAQTQPKDPHTEALITMVTTYDPDVKMVLDVSIAVDTTNVKASLVPRREGPDIRQCAKVRLSERHIVKKTREVHPDETEPETMILTSPPGSPEKLQQMTDRKSREICFINIQRNLRARGVILRHQYPDVYRKLCVYVEKNESFPPVTIYPRDTNTGKTFMCLIMPDSDPEILEWVQNPDLLEDIIA